MPQRSKRHKAVQQVLSVRVPQEIRKELDRLAAADRRTVSSLLQIILTDYIGKSRTK